jgi:hypothetical protein
LWENIGRDGQHTVNGEIYVELYRPQVVGNIGRIEQATDGGKK